MARGMRGQAEGLALVVMAMLLVAGIASIVYGLRRVQETGREVSQLAALISEKTGEQVYFKIENGIVYARSTLTTRIKQVVVYNSSTGVLEHNETLDLYLPAGEWEPLPLSHEAVNAVANGSMILLALTERGNLVAYDPKGLTEDIVRIIQGLPSPGSGVYYYKNYGYRVSYGSVIDVNGALLGAPIDCAHSNYLRERPLYYCNVIPTTYNNNYWFPVFLTYNMNMSGLVTHYGDTAILKYNPSFRNYTQIFRVLRVRGVQSTILNVTYNVSTYASPVSPLSGSLVPVVYIYKYAPSTVYMHIALVSSKYSYYTDEAQMWLKRILLDSVQSINGTPWIKTYSIQLDTRSLGEDDALVFIGFEGVGEFSFLRGVRVLIDISGDGVTVVS